jgi:hypothetical protein
MKKKIKKNNNCSGKEIGQGFFEDDEEQGSREEIRSFSSVGQKNDRDFFCEEKNVVQKCWEIKYKEKKNEEIWQILCDKKNIFEISSNKILEIEKKYLRSAEGIQFLLSYVKKNIHDSFFFSNFHSALKLKI